MEGATYYSGVAIPGTAASAQNICRPILQDLQSKQTCRLWHSRSQMLIHPSIHPVLCDHATLYPLLQEQHNGIFLTWTPVKVFPV